MPKTNQYRGTHGNLRLGRTCKSEWLRLDRSVQRTKNPLALAMGSVKRDWRKDNPGKTMEDCEKATRLPHDYVKRVWGLIDEAIEIVRKVNGDENLGTLSKV